MTDARYTKDAPFEGLWATRLPQVLANKWSAYTQYSAPLTGGIDGFARADVEHTGIFYNDGSNTLSFRRHDSAQSAGGRRSRQALA